MILGDEIYLYDDIARSGAGYGTSAESFAADLRALNGQRSITVRINSGGGSVFEGIAIAEAIHQARRLGHRITTVVDGVAASIASVIALAGSPVKMSEAGLLMIHLPFAPDAAGTADDLRKTIDVLEKVADRLVAVYHKKTGKSEATIRGWLEKESWFDAAEALAIGFIDEIVTEPSRLAGCIDVTKFDAPKQVLARARKPVDDMLRVVFSACRNARQSDTDDDCEYHLGRAGRAAQALCNTPGVRSVDMAIACSALKRWNQDWSECY